MPDNINRMWAEVYSPLGVFLGQVNDIIDADNTKFLDGVGSFNLTLTGTIEEDFTLLVAGNRVLIYIQEFTDSRLFGGGIVRSVKVSDGSGGGRLVVSGPDFLDELTRKSVLLGLSFNNNPVDDVITALISLVPGWTATSLESLGNMSGRYDGASVLNALIRTVQENGIHFRQGDTNTDLEYGAFGNPNGLILRNPPGSVTEEIDDNDDILFVTQIQEDSDADKIVDWIIPLGAGEGSAGWTLKYSTRTTPYPIQTMVGPDGGTIYYLSVANSPAEASQRVVTFKEIGPIANSDSAKILASNALYDAAVAWLDRNSVPLVTYSVACTKNRVNVRPGDMIRLTYKGKVRTSNKKWFNRIDVDQDFWIMKVTEKATSGGTSLQLTINSVDRFKQDTTQMIVGALESVNATKLSVQTFPCRYRDSSRGYVQADSFGPSGLNYLKAKFSILIDDTITDIIQAKIRFQTENLFTPLGLTASLTWDGAMYAIVQKTDWFPNQLHMYVNGVDVSATYGGPWGDGTVAVDITCDISDLLINAVGGMYQDHLIEFDCEPKTGSYVYPTHGTGTSSYRSNGVVFFASDLMVLSRAVIPAP